MTEEAKSVGTVIDKDKVKDLVQKLQDKDDDIIVLRTDKKNLIDEYTKLTGVPDKKTLMTAISLAKKRGIERGDIDALLEIIDPIVN